MYWRRVRNMESPEFVETLAQIAIKYMKEKNVLLVEITTEAIIKYVQDLQTDKKRKVAVMNYLKEQSNEIRRIQVMKIVMTRANIKES